MPLGIAATAHIFASLFGWNSVLQPIADAMPDPGQSVSMDRAALVGVGAIMLAKWAIAWLSFLPRASSVRNPA